MFFTGITRYADPLIEEQVKTESSENDKDLDSMVKIVKMHVVFLMKSAMIFS